MKGMILALALLGISGLALANPIESIYMSRFWFDTQGNLNVLYSSQIYQVSEIDLFDGTNHYLRTINPDNPSTFTQVYPEANCSLQQGELQTSYFIDPPYYITDEVSWGSSLTDDLSPLLPGQCGQQFYLATDPENTIKYWAKDLLDNPGSIYGPIARCTLNIFCHTENGNPVAEVPIHIFSGYFPAGHSAADGWFHTETYCSRLTVVARGPSTNSTLFSDTFFAEPGQSYNLDVLVNSSAAEDPGEILPIGKLTAYPSVLRSSQNAALHLEYAGKAGTDAYYSLYDLKGREIASRIYSEEACTWQLPKLPSGVYFVSLKDKHRTLDTRKLIVLK